MLNKISYKLVGYKVSLFVRSKYFTDHFVAHAQESRIEMLFEPCLICLIHTRADETKYRNIKSRLPCKQRCIKIFF